MIAIDTNVLIYAHRGDLPAHELAATAVNDAFSGAEAVAIPWPVAHEFLAVVTSARVFALPTPMDIAVAQLSAWLASPRAVPLHESGRHLETLSALVTAGRVTGGSTHDARIAAICLDHGVRELLTSDRDFTRYPSLRVRNPLVA